MSISPTEPACSQPFTTGCECHPSEFPFRCARHGCRKNAHYHRLCSTQPAYFRMYEEGHGPGQFPAESLANSANPTPPEGPGMLQRAWNLAGSIAAFVADGCQTVSAEQFQMRLQICDSCDQRRDAICGACGCYISIKARLRAITRPLRKWPPGTGDGDLAQGRGTDTVDQLNGRASHESRLP